MKKFNLFLIIAFALTAFLVGYLLVGGEWRSGPKLKTGAILDKFSDTQQPTTDSQQPTDETKPLLLTDRRVVSVTNSLNKGGVLYYEKNTGKIFEFNLEAKTETPISENMLPNFISAIWSPAKKEVIGSFYSQSGSDFRYYNLDTVKNIKFDPNVQSPVFSPDGNLIAYYYLNKTANSSEAGKIMISQPDGTYSKKILDTRLQDIKISWPTGEWLVLKTPSEIFLLSQDGKLNKFLEFRTVLEERWSRSGKRMLYSALSDNDELAKSVLAIKELDSRDERSLEIEGNASKCVWSIDEINIFCALAKSPSVDEIYLINTADRSRKLIADTEMPIKELFLSASEEYLLLVNAGDEKLYKISNL